MMNFSVEQLTKISTHILMAAGSTKEEANTVAQHLIEANLKGHDSHGIGMLALYAKSLLAGQINPNTPARLINDAGAILQFDGDLGYGQRTGKEAMAAAIERAKTTGICLMTLAHTNHLGRIGSYGEQAIAAGMISLHFVNINSFHPIVAPFCGSAPRFGTNPICIAIPGTEENPAFLLDFATSMVAHGKARVAYLAEKKFNDNVFLDHQGIPSNDPKTLLEEPFGALRPMAEHKGGGLVVACELLAGLLSKGGTLQPAHERKGSIVNNMSAIVINPDMLAPRAWFGQEYDAMLDYIRSSPAPYSEEHPVLIAGEPERKTQAYRKKHGIDISENEWKAIIEAGLSLGAKASDFS
ncbi:MAG: malate/lactate/ureidoglycolate dehydrogenase [Saezia sp.]